MMVQKSTHQIAAPIISISLVFFLFNGACSQEEKPLPSSQTYKIVRAISKAPGLAKENEPQVDENSKLELDEKGSAETIPVVNKERGPETPKIVTEEALPEEEPGIYVVRNGDTLAGVAAREDVYGDPLKWAILGRHNLDKLMSTSITEVLPDKVLSEGMKLKFMTQDEVVTNLGKRDKKKWTLNLLSSPNKDEVVPVVVKLIRAGFPVYITRASVKGTNYMRVRVGFFSGKTEASREGKKLLEILGLSDFWITEATEKEAREFGGY